MKRHASFPPFLKIGARRPLLALLLSAWLLSGCETNHIDPEAEAAFLEDLATYRQARLDDLTQPDSWLSLAGLYWLKEGDNRVGTDPSNDLVFPEGKAPAYLGTITLADTTVRMTIAPGVEVKHVDAPVTEALLTSDAEEDPMILTHSTLQWYVIKRGERFAIRLKDSQSPALTGFDSLNTFTADFGWHIEGTFEPYDPPKPIPVPDIFGNIADRPALGALVFEQNGTSYRLDVIRDGDEPKFFLLFADETSGRETYGGGRYLKVEEPAPGSNEIVIDFNRAYNPPCVFTPFATCPLPPKQNRLPIRVEAGEKKYAKAMP